MKVRTLSCLVQLQLPDTVTNPQERTAVEGQTEADSASEHVEVGADLQPLISYKCLILEEIFN